jgi:hypothetical protein
MRVNAETGATELHTNEVTRLCSGGRDNNKIAQNASPLSSAKSDCLKQGDYNVVEIFCATVGRNPALTSKAFVITWPLQATAPPPQQPRNANPHQAMAGIPSTSANNQHQRLTMHSQRTMEIETRQRRVEVFGVCLQEASASDLCQG